MSRIWTGRFEGYSVDHFKKDLLSGTIVGIVAVPLAMSLALIGGTVIFHRTLEVFSFCPEEKR